MAMNFVSGVHSDNGAVATNNAVISYPASVAAGDMLILSMTAFGSGGIHTTTPPSGWTRIIGIFSTFSMSAFYRIADGSETGTFSYGLAASLLFSAQVCRFTTTGYFTAASITGALSNTDTTDNYQFVGPNPGTVPTGGYGWSHGSGRSGTTTSPGVSGNNWVIAGSFGYNVSPNSDVHMTAYKVVNSSGAATFKFGGSTVLDWLDFRGIAFLMNDFALPASTGLFFGTNH